MRPESARKTGRRSSRFRVFGLPCLAKYFQHKREEGHILNEIQATCLAPREGVLAFRGGTGVGKTSLLTHIFADESNYTFFLRECKIDTIVWLNCQEFTSASGTDEDVEIAFTKRLLQIGRSTCQDDPFALFYSLNQMMQYISINKRHRILIGLDDVCDLKLIQLLRREAPEVCCCAILGENFNTLMPEKIQPGLVKKTFLVEPMPDEQIYDLLSATYDLKHKLKDAHIRELSQYCFGHHLLANHLAYRVNDCFDYLAQMKERITEIKQTINATPLLLTRQIYEANLNKMDPILHKNYHAFLLYQPGEPVSLDDLVILWGFCGDCDAKERALQFCSFFEKKCLIRRVYVVGNQAVNNSETGYYFILHPFLFDRAVENSKKHYKIDISETKKFLSKLRLQIAQGSACTDGANVKTAIDIACQCVAKQRRHLLEKIVDILDPVDLATLIRHKADLSRQKTLLHYLYETKWNDDVTFNDKANISRGINHSYRLIANIFAKLRRGGVNLGPIICERDELTGGSFLKSVFKDLENKPQHKLDRLPLQREISKFQHEYEEQVWHDSLLSQKDPIVTAILRNDLQVLRDLLTKKMKSPEFKGERLAFASARLDKLDALKIICEKFTSDIVMQMVENETGFTVFSLAARNGHLEVLNYLFLLKSDIITWRNAKNGKTLLMSAATNGHLNVVRYLSEMDGESVGSEMEPSFGSYTALALAANNGHVETVKFLAETCPDSVKFGKDASRNALTLAAENGHTAVVTLLSELFPDLVDANALNYALSNNQIEAAKILISKRKELITSLSEPGTWSPLMSAASDCDLEGVIFLYELNKDAIKVTDASGWTPLMAAVNRSKLDVVIFLYEKYPDAVKIQDESGYTPLALASQGGCLDLVQFLFERYPEAVEMLDSNGETPFMRAVFSDYGDLSIVRFLFDKYSDAIGIRNSYGVTPLMNAAFKFHLEICRFLCEAFPAGVDWRDENGKTALDYAKAAAALNEKRRRAVIAYLSSKIKPTSGDTISEE